MQRHDQRPTALGGIIFGHIEREAAAAAGVVVVVKYPAGLGRGLVEAGVQRGVVTQGGIDEELVHRRQTGRERIERLLRARQMTQRAKHRDKVALALLRPRASPQKP